MSILQKFDKVRPGPMDKPTTPVATEQVCDTTK
jgi:hypothetical protein